MLRRGYDLVFQFDVAGRQYTDRDLKVCAFDVTLIIVDLI
jgi:hypothetical protein